MSKYYSFIYGNIWFLLLIIICIRTPPSCLLRTVFIPFLFITISICFTFSLFIRILLLPYHYFLIPLLMSCLPNLFPFIVSFSHFSEFSSPFHASTPLPTIPSPLHAHFRTLSSPHGHQSPTSLTAQTSVVCSLFSPFLHQLPLIWVSEGKPAPRR